MKDGEKLRIHNWVVEKIEMDGTDYVEVSNTGGDFRMMYREGSTMYAMLSGMEDDDEVKESLALVFGNVLSTANVLDAKFQHDVLVATVGMIDRINAEDDKDGSVSEQILHEMKAEYEMKKESESDSQ